MGVVLCFICVGLFAYSQVCLYRFVGLFSYWQVSFYIDRSLSIDSQVSFDRWGHGRWLLNELDCILMIIYNNGLYSLTLFHARRRSDFKYLRPPKFQTRFHKSPQNFKQVFTESTGVPVIQKKRKEICRICRSKYLKSDLLREWISNNIVLSNNGLYHYGWIGLYSIGMCTFCNVLLREWISNNIVLSNNGLYYYGQIGLYSIGLCTFLNVPLREWTCNNSPLLDRTTRQNNTLQHTATHRSVLQCVATHCNTLRHIRTTRQNNTLQHTAMCRSVLQCVVLSSNGLYYYGRIGLYAIGLCTCWNVYCYDMGWLRLVGSLKL